MTKEIKGKTILITGGTGSLGQATTEALYKYAPKKIIIYSRGERQQVEMERMRGGLLLRYFLGDIRDRERLYRALNGVDYVIHAAALKHVDKCQYNPFETIQTNILGTQNVIDMCIERGVKRVLNVSSDKAVSPCNIYGATKLCSEFMFKDASAYSNDTKFLNIRFGNFWDSSESVIAYWQRMYDEGFKRLPITNKKATRHFIKLEKAAEMCLKVLAEGESDKVYVPEMKKYNVYDLGVGLFPTCEFEEVGLRPGEKLHEELYGEHEENSIEVIK